jgi:hypothetical protein
MIALVAPLLHAVSLLSHTLLDNCGTLQHCVGMCVYAYLSVLLHILPSYTAVLMHVLEACI